MKAKFKEKTKEALSSVAPITVIVFFLSIFVVQMPIETIMMFIFGAFMLILGIGLFSLGVDIALSALGEDIGARITSNKKIWIMLIVVFIIGVVVTAAEPDLAVLANQVPAMPNMVMIITVSVGVGIFLMFSVLRLIFKIQLKYVLIFFYIIIFAVSFFTPASFLPIAFDSGGVTTGPITVPFIMAFGLGLVMKFAGGSAEDDSFGFVALCSCGPILATMVLGIVYNTEGAQYSPLTLAKVVTMRDVAEQFATNLPHYAFEVFVAAMPIILLFVVFQLVTRMYRRMQIGRMSFGFLYIFVGLILFLTGVNVGFIPVGSILGSQIGSSDRAWLLIPVGMVLGFYTVVAEPAVHVLNKQVEEVSGGTIPQSAMKWALSLGVAASLGLTMVRILTGISIYWLLIPGYVIALVLTFFVPKIFTGIAFDSGGVASGPMASTFILPFALGACEGAGGNVLRDAFGAVAMIAMTPLITIQIMGLISSIKASKLKGAEPEFIVQPDEIIDFDIPSSQDTASSDWAQAMNKQYYDDDRR